MGSKAARNSDKAVRPEVNGRSKHCQPLTTPPEQLAAVFRLNLATLAQAANMSEDKLVRPETEWDEVERTRFDRVQEILLSLGRVVRIEYIAPWMEKPNKACKGKTPLQLMQNGEYDRLDEMLYRLHAGEPW